MHVVFWRVVCCGLLENAGAILTAAYGYKVALHNAMPFDGGVCGGCGDMRVRGDWGVNGANAHGFSAGIEAHKER